MLSRKTTGGHTMFLFFIESVCLLAFCLFLIYIQYSWNSRKEFEVVRNLFLIMFPFVFFLFLMNVIWFIIGDQPSANEFLVIYAFTYASISVLMIMVFYALSGHQSLFSL